MSGLLAGKVWQSDLDPELKPLAAALADIARNDGTKIYPSVAYVAWLLGRTERSVQMGMARLRELGILRVVRQGGGRNQTTEYTMDESRLPARDSWGETASEVGEGNNETVSPLPENQRNMKQERVKPTSPDPLVSVSHSKAKQGKPAQEKTNPENNGHEREEPNYRIFVHRSRHLLGFHPSRRKSILEAYEKCLAAAGTHDRLLEALEEWVINRGGKDYLKKNKFRILALNDFFTKDGPEILEAMQEEREQSNDDGIPVLDPNED